MREIQEMGAYTKGAFDMAATSGVLSNVAQENIMNALVFMYRNGKSTKPFLTEKEYEVEKEKQITTPAQHK